MRKTVLLLFLIFIQFFNAQFRNSLYDNNQLNISVRGGLDFPAYSNQTEYIDYKSNLNLGASVDFYFTWIGVGIDADYLKNMSKNSYPTERVFLGTTELSNFKLNENKIQRYFFGIGPNFKWAINDNLGLIFKLKGGISNIKGGETSLSGSAGTVNYPLNYSAGYDDKNVITGKGQAELNWFFSENIGLNVGGYYIHHFKANDLVKNGYSYYHTPFTTTNNQNNISPASQIVRTSALDHEIHSVGFFAGITFRIPTKGSGPNYGLSVIARDKQTGLILPDTFIELYKNGKRTYFARTNAQGVAFFKNIKPDNYEIRGSLYNIDLISTQTNKTEFVKNTMLKKEISTDELFFVKGQVNICNSNNPLKDVTVVAKNDITEIVTEIKTDINGKFYFKADKNTTYSIYGKKGNFFSQTESISSKNVDRSNTLFLDLQVCMEETTCGKPINLKNIHYDLDKYFVRDDAKLELNKLVQFMKDNPKVTVELSSHTDSRASDEYNKTLSQNRANAAVEYLAQKGINKLRLKPIGYGETKLLNKCSNDVDCTEEQHQINRRTEMKVICP